MPNQDTEKKLQEFVLNEEQKTVNLNNLSDTAPIIAATKLPFQKREEQISANNQIGWQSLPIQDLPTKGMFYPSDATVSIRSATAQEIRHWSTINEEDLSTLDDMLNYVLERCVAYKQDGSPASWKYIKEIDRFYILLAVREYTFVKGENHLQVKTSETSTINVRKEMIDFIQFDEKLIKYYDSEKRCFKLNFKTGESVEATIPSVGVTNFLKHYINRKQQEGLSFDMDFISYAPFVIKDWKGLNDHTYEQLVLESNNWSISQISVLTKLKDLFIDTVNPIVKYIDEGGAERHAPLNFLGGIKSIFLISDPFGELV